MDAVIPVLAIVVIILLFLEAFRIAVRGFLINYQVVSTKSMNGCKSSNLSGADPADDGSYSAACAIDV